MKYKLFFFSFILFVLLGFVGCDKNIEADYSLAYFARHNNESSHAITVSIEEVASADLNHATYTLSFNEYIDFCSLMTLGGNPDMDYDIGYAVLLVPTNASVVFDGIYCVEYSSWNNDIPKELNICKPAAYSKEFIENRGWVLTHTFTDADYDYAKEYGTKLLD